MASTERAIFKRALQWSDVQLFCCVLVPAVQLQQFFIP